jgi:hypothetical protein
VEAGEGLAQSDKGGEVVYVSQDLEKKLFWELIETTLWGGHFQVIQSGLLPALVV